ncbi:MAG: hypothetical protein PWQ57_902 [Desulfovibrionales bacterium]|nr:hypothetical protein [Desulfovibrionales bacterium]
MPVSIEALQPKEALAYWRDKAAVSDSAFRRMDNVTRSRAFAVSGMSQLDQVGRVMAAVHETLAEGKSLGKFKQEVAPLLMDELGLSPTVARRKAELILRTNLQSAYMAGRYTQMMEAAEARPYWRYAAVGDARTRPSHAALHGTVRRYDDPFWGQFYPPNGFACRCTVQTLSERQAAARGIEVGQGVPDRLLYKDPKTGMEHWVTPMPDAGWSGNVGQDWLAGLAPTLDDAKLQSMPGAHVCPQGNGQHAAPACWLPLDQVEERHIRKIADGDILPAGKTQVSYIGAFLDEFGLKFGQSKTINLPGVGSPLVISDRLFLDKRTNTYKITKGGRERYATLLARTILDPWEIWMSPARTGGKPVAVLNLFRLFADKNGKVGGFAAFRLYGRQWQGSTVFVPQGNEQRILKYLEEQRLEMNKAGVLLYREP